MDTDTNVQSTELYLVERYWPGVTEPELRAAVSKVRLAVSEMAGGGVLVKHLRSTLIPGEESVFCMFEGSSADDVAQANRRAGVRFDRISPVIDVYAEGKRPSKEPKEVER